MLPRRSEFGRSLLMGNGGVDMENDSFVSPEGVLLSASLSSPSPSSSSTSSMSIRREVSIGGNGEVNDDDHHHRIVLVETHVEYRAVLLRPPLTDRIVTAIVYFDPNESYRRIIESWEENGSDETAAERSTWIEVARDNSSALKQASVVLALQLFLADVSESCPFWCLLKQTEMYFHFL